MAPVKPTKKPPKVMEKPVEKTIVKSKTKKKNYHSFSIYLYKILKQVGQEKIGITRKAMFIMDNFVYDMLGKMADEAGKLVSLGKKTTMTASDIQGAIKLMVPGELAKHANIEGSKAYTMYVRNKPNN